MSLFSKFKAWLNDDTFVQLGHGAGGYGITLSPLLWGRSWHQLLIGIALVLAWSVPKEYVFDVLVEKASFTDGWTDQRSYLIGSAIAAGVFAISRWI